MKFPIAALLVGAAVALTQVPTGSQTSIYEHLLFVDPIVDEAVQTGLIPGAVVVIGHNDQVIFRKAYGSRALIPLPEPMTVDTIFDAASLTKVVATTPSIMKLVEQGKLRIDDPVTKYLPEFQGSKSDITVRLLMTHFSGMPPDLELVPKWSGYSTGVEKALITVPVAPPGARFIYSDINYVLLAEIVHRLSAEAAAAFAQYTIYPPLHMKDSGFPRLKGPGHGCYPRRLRFRFSFADRPASRCFSSIRPR
jgi:CubicO group peptidase (beta-lactamase class C family)